MTRTEEAPDSPNQQVMTAGPEAGEILVGRYRLEEHINDDASGRRVWRGIDVVLRRPIAVVLRYPGGESAGEMITAAIAASRIAHPHLVDVYDAIDEETRAYVVREWVDGVSLRELVADGPLDSVRATSVAHAVASAVAAAHASGMPHGNVHPGSVLIADDGRVVLADARADEFATVEHDVRAVGAVLYCALTGHWPYAEAGDDRLPDAVRDSAGALASPRQVRGGLPSVLSEIATDLLNPALEPPTAAALSAELARLDTAENDDLFGDAGPLSFTSGAGIGPTGPRPRNGRKMAVGVAALLAVAIAGLIMATKIGDSPKQGAAINPAPTATASQQPAAQSKPIKVQNIRIVDPSTKSDGSELPGAIAMIDGDNSTSWKTSTYRTADFGGPGYKPGMGVLLDLGQAVDVASITVVFGAPGATVEARLGESDPGEGHTGDSKILDTYTKAAGGPIVDTPPSTVLNIGAKTRYVLLWMTKLPRVSGGYRVTIDEITVNGS